jgi:hypothetical protein
VSRKASRSAQLVFLKGNDIAARDGGEGFVYIGFRPCHIVALIGRAFGNALVNELARRLFDRSEITPGDTGSKPFFLLGRECDRHASSFHKNSRSNMEIVERF